METASQTPRILGVTITYCNGKGEVRQRTIHAAPGGDDRVGGLVWDRGAFGSTVECGQDVESETVDSRRIPGPQGSALGVACAESPPQGSGLCWWDPRTQQWVCPTDLD